MPTIKFTATPELPFDIAHLGYKAGDVLEMNDASARRWVRRGVAVYWTDDKQHVDPDGLRLDGPTVDEYVKAGYVARNYPPRGYASRSTEEEIAAAIAAQVEKIADLPIALDPVLMPEPANEIGNSDEKPAEAVADVEENGEGEPAIEPAIFAGHESATAEDESPKRRGRKAKVVSDE